MTSVPPFWVVTPSLNGERYIQDCILAVREAFGEFAYRHVIVDGGSTDGTVRVTQSLEHDNLALVEAPGTTMYEAINLGLADAPSDSIVYQINIDDIVLPWAAHAAANALAQDDARGNTLDLVIGGCVTIDIREQSAKVKMPVRGSLSTSWLGNNMFLHQPGIFIRYEALRRVGGYPTAFQYAGDTALWCKMAEDGACATYVRAPLAIDRLHGDSARLSPTHLAELQEIRDQYSTTARPWTRTANVARYLVAQLAGAVRPPAEFTQRDTPLLWEGSLAARVLSVFLTNARSRLVYLGTSEGVYPLRGRIH